MKKANIFLTTEWINIPKLLEHENLKISYHHSGLGSIGEAFLAGKPMIATPPLNTADPFKSCFQIELSGWGKCIPSVD